MTEFQISKQEVRNFLINRSFLVKKAKSLEEYFDKFLCVQVDPIDLIAKSHELSLWNRVENFKLGDLDKVLYENRSLFEYWMQLYSIVPIKFRSKLSYRMKYKGGWQDEFYKEHKSQIKLAKDAIIQNGPTTSKDLKHIPKTKAIFEWRSYESGKATLDYLWERGEISISHRKSKQKVYDLTVKLFPKEFLQSESSQKSLEFLVKSHFKYLGIIRKIWVSRSGYSFYKEVYKKFDELLVKGEIIKLKIEGIKTKYFILKEDLAELKNLSTESKHNSLNILPPLDPLIIDRKALKDFFDFEYTWEFYTPPAKRKFSMYGMPILYKGEFVGQVELKRDKDRNVFLSIMQCEADKKLLKNLEIEIMKLNQFIN